MVAARLGGIDDAVAAETLAELIVRATTAPSRASQIYPPAASE
jgi:hypothetical protein